VIALASWVIYAVHLYASVAKRERGRLCAWLLVGGYVVVIAGLLVPTVSDGPHRFV
jgi:ABC-type transport system involved in cytochrome c biogenesis permease subunit